MNYQEALDWLYSTQTFGIKLGLDGPRKLLRQFLAFPKSGVKVIHVAGTNGKGSTCAFIDALARSTGVRTGLFTSPHLIDFRERVRVNGEMIPEQEVTDALNELRDMLTSWEHHPTFFELTLAIALRHFKACGCELIILETGMGGRLDATTAVPADVCVVTPIALDHSEFLGDTLEKVAFEKAGIILEDVPVISAKQAPEAARVIAERADELRAPLSVVDTPLSGYTIKLAGLHQAHNAHLALEAASAAGLQLSYDSVQYAMASVSWPGRFETLSTTPQIIIDGAHNPHAATALVDTWTQQFGSTKAQLVFGAMQEKDIAPVLTALSSISAEVHFVPVDSPRAMQPDALAALLPEQTVPTTTHSSLATCLESLATSEQPILISGSLFLIGEASALLSEQHFQRSSQ